MEFDICSVFRELVPGTIEGAGNKFPTHRTMVDRKNKTKDKYCPHCSHNGKDGTNHRRWRGERLSHIGETLKQIHIVRKLSPDTSTTGEEFDTIPFLC